MKRWLLALPVLLVVAVYLGVSATVADHLTLGTHRPLDGGPTEVSTAYQHVSFPSRVDQLTLRGWLFFSAQKTGRSVIIVHGKNQNRINRDYNAEGLARDLLAHGYDVLLFDLRSSGTSDGQRFTLGTLEVRDVLGAVDFLQKRHYRQQRMVLIGDSMGAASVLEATPSVPQMGAVVVDSAYAELRPILDRDLPKNSHLPAFFDPGIYLMASLLDGTDANLRPIDAVKAVPHRAFLLFAGTKDQLVPDSNSIEIKAASKNPETQLVIVPGADHVKAFRVAPQLYLQTLYQFLNEQLAERS
jgi:pimeloyl-ACP methyl ester carboxylesterase